MKRFNSIEERRAWYREYYRINHQHLRDKDNARYKKKAIAKRQKRNNGKHPLLISDKKPRTGTIKSCPVCSEEFYCKPYRPEQLCCNENCTKKLLKGKTIRCLVCYNEFPCCDSQLKQRNRKTCSRSCHTVYIKETSFLKRLLNPASVKSVDRCLRYSKEMDDWRMGVFVRDNYTCVKCGIRSKRGQPVYLEAHHIKQFATHPELRFDLSNGETLCKPCHNKIPHLRNVKSKKKCQES